MSKSDKEEVSRRNWLAWGGLGLAAATLKACGGDDCETPEGTDGTATTGSTDGTDVTGTTDVTDVTDTTDTTDTTGEPTDSTDTTEPPPVNMDGVKLGMVIDLHNCTGCGACVISCKNENNVQDGVLWGNRVSKTEGTFPDVKYSFYPTLCNQCEDAPCVAANKSGALYKGPGGITMIDKSKFGEGDELSAESCPYGRLTYNAAGTHEFWKNDKALIDGVTSAPSAVAGEVGGEVIPHYNPDKEPSKSGSGVTNGGGGIEKCTFCDHRVLKGEEPYCVEACPTGARVFGDIASPYSEVSQLLAEHDAWRDKEEAGTNPRVFYIRKYNADS